ncbi:hypothetical protein Q8F55_001494 [Vanrija albida]|uniref:Alpha 1,4-glycosyltransferase domain-containing protein n=1 Tax=Vanrija albida TaxID=181172 RepID=A0ABR3QGD1_9TREE
MSPVSPSYRYRLLPGGPWRDQTNTWSRRRVVVTIGAAVFVLGLAAHWFVAPDAVKSLWESSTGSSSKGSADPASASGPLYPGGPMYPGDPGVQSYPDTFYDVPEPTTTFSEEHDWPAPHHTIAAEKTAPTDTKNHAHDHEITDLGDIADQRYKIGFKSFEEGDKMFFKRLHDFALRMPYSLQPALLASLHAHLPPAHSNLLPAPENPPEPPQDPAMVSYKNIFQTDFKEPGELTQKWRDMNAPDGWTLDWYDDARSEAWVRDVFAPAEEIEGGGVWWAYDYFTRGVLKADLLRYLLPLVKGGVYADVDTKPIRRIEEWGHLDVDVLDIEQTDGPDWHDKMATNAAIMVGFETDVHEKEGWFHYWPRPVGVCQWALASAPSHPIMLEVVRRVVNGTHFVQEHEKRAEREGHAERDAALSVIEWTGPGAFSDAVFAYLLARYDVSWHHVRGLRRPLRVGDVLILPITAFASGGEGDFEDEGPESPQALLQHFLRGGWKSDGQ